MVLDAPQPPAKQEAPFVPPVEPPLVFDTFDGLDTNASRPGIDDKKCYWIDGWFPLGRNNLRTLPGIGPPVYTSEAGTKVVFFDFGNIGTKPIMIVLHDNGRVESVDPSTGLETQILAAGTITNPSSTSIGVSQWGSQYIIIVANQANGYWLWDGTNIFSAGSIGPDVTIVNNGLDYTSQPTITANGGAGTGASFSAVLLNGFVQQVSILNPGSGYLVTDAAILAFTGGGSTGKTATGFGVVSAGTIASVSVTAGGAGYTSTAVGSLLGGGGANTSVSIVVSAGTVASVSMLARGIGYTTSPVLFVTDPNNPVAQAEIDMMPFGVQGTAAETFQSRVWVVNGPEVEFTAPGSVVDFSTSSGGGAFVSTDSFLRYGFTQPKQSNGFLYLIADSSMNYLSGVQTSGTPPTTTFTNQNANPEIGTPWAPTVDVFGSNILFANAFGAQVSYGGAVKKISEPLDGVYNTVPNFGGLTPSAGKAIIFGKKCWILLLPIIDPVSQTRENKLLIWNERIWFTSRQEVPLTFIQHQEINSVITCYGTDGNSIYPLFNRPSPNFTKTVQSKLWDKPGGYFERKVATRLFGIANYNSILAPTLLVSVDNENGSAPPVALNPPALVWRTADDSVMNWTTADGSPMIWLSPGITSFDPVPVAQQGDLIGLTVTTNAADVTLISMSLFSDDWAYRG
jgi:hypothetical protein